MQYLPDHDVLVMSLVDLEHCGFSYDDFVGELFLHGCEAADWPTAILVNFAGGHVLTPDTPPGHLRRYKKANEAFQAILEAVVGVARQPTEEEKDG